MTRSALTEDQVRAIWNEYRAHGNARRIGRAFGVSGGTVDDIVHGRTWRHLGLAPLPMNAGPRYRLRGDNGATWTRREERLLARLWNECTPAEEIVRQIGRTWVAIYARARHVMYLPIVPQGFVTVHEASERCGMDDKTLRYVLRLRDVPVHPCYPCERSVAMSRARIRPGRIVVEWDAAREAVEWYAARETPAHAAIRYGVYHEDVIRALARIGVRVPRLGRGARVWIECAVIDRAMEAA